MTAYDPFSSPHVDAALYFTDQGQYLFKAKQEGGCISKTLREPEVCAAFTRKGFDSGWLGNGIIRMGSNTKGKWYVYLAARTTVSVNFDNKEGCQIPLPVTLLIAVGTTYHLFALKVGKYPGAFFNEAEVFEAPFPNVHPKSGLICWGNNPVPKFDVVYPGIAWVSFFSTPFNGDLAENKSKKYPKDVRTMLRSLESKAIYPDKDLVSTKMNIDQLIKKLVGERFGMNMGTLVDYRRATSAHNSMKLPVGTLYSYIWAANGIFIYSENEYFRVLMPLRWWKMDDERKTVRGLAPLEPYFHLNSPFVSCHILNWILESSRRVVPDEMLFFIRRNPGCMWYAAIPVQKFGSTFCQAIEPGDYCPIELHSHNVMPAFFSNTDNKEETGLRIYAVLGKVTNPVADIRVRVSVYGHYWTIPYESVFEPCDEVKNV